MELTRNILRQMIMDTVVLDSKYQFLEKHSSILVEHMQTFNPAAQLEGRDFLHQVREICTQLDKGEKPGAVKAKAVSAKPAKSVEVVIFDDGKPKISKGFDRYWDAEKWAARQIVDMPYHHATVNGKMMDSIQAARMMYSRIGGSTVMKTRTFNTSGPWQKAQQSKASFSRG